MDNAKHLAEIEEKLHVLHDHLETVEQAQNEDADEGNPERFEDALSLIRQAAEAVAEIVP